MSPRPRLPEVIRNCDWCNGRILIRTTKGKSSNTRVYCCPSHKNMAWRRRTNYQRTRKEAAR